MRPAAAEPGCGLCDGTGKVAGFRCRLCRPRRWRDRICRLPVLGRRRIRAGMGPLADAGFRRDWVDQVIAGIPEEEVRGWLTSPPSS